MTTNAESAEVMREEILAEARRQGREIIERAVRDAEAATARAAAEADAVRKEHVDRARAEAARQREMILATITVETGRLQAERIETLLESVRRDVRRLLLAHDGFEYRETVITLASHAIHRMAGETIVLRMSETDRIALGNGFIEDIGHRVGRPALSIAVSYEPGLADDGVVVEGAEAHQMWDNRLTKRLERMWPELRRHLAVQASFVPKPESGEGGP